MKNSTTIIQATPEMRQHLKANKRPIRFDKQFDFSFKKLYSPGIRTKQLAEFTRQLAALLEARLPLIRSLEILSKQMTNQKLQHILAGILSEIKEGQSFSNCLKNHPKVFDDFFVSLVRVGEQGGILEKTLNRLANYLEKMAALHRKILTAMTYPLVIVLVATGAITFLLVAVVPTFADMFQDFGGQLPGPTQFLLSMSALLKENFWLLLLSILILGYAFVRIKRTQRGSYFFDKISLKAPLFGSLFKKNFLARFCRTLGTLLSSGVTLVQSLEVTQTISKNKVFKNAIVQMKDRIIQGKPMMELVGKLEPFTPLTIQMIRVGEETGELDAMLEKVAKFYEQELDATVEALTSIIEPVIIVFLGVILGGALIAMYLQLFNLVNVIQ